MNIQKSHHTPEHPVFELTYCSKAIPGLSQDDISDILQTARKFNARHGITGCLLYHNEEFVQILEGEKSLVKKLFESIKQDPRHYDVTLLLDGSKGDIHFSDWNMAYAEYDQIKGHMGEIKQFENNMMVLAELTSKDTSTSRIFWSMVKNIMKKRNLSQT
ncbi:MAG: BLUF domain-containing protein [Pricia sp.]